MTNSFTPGPGGQALSVPAAGVHQQRGSTGDVSSVGMFQSRVFYLLKQNMLQVRK